jgi:hypothetical protein
MSPSQRQLVNHASPHHFFDFLLFPVNVSWIAFIDCDRNATGASLETDIISPAKSQGAGAAVRTSILSSFPARF